MATMQYFQEDLYPPDNNGRADVNKAPVNVEMIRTTFFGDDQIFLRLRLEDQQVVELHLNKSQATELAEGLNGAVAYIGYDNS